MQKKKVSSRVRLKRIVIFVMNMFMVNKFLCDTPLEWDVEFKSQARSSLWATKSII